MIGLCLIALGAYLTLVLYFGWDGGRVGSGAETGLTFLLGKVAYAVPVMLLGTAAALILKPFLPAIAPLRTGGLCLLAGLLLAFAAQTLGLGPDQPPRGDSFDSTWFEDHGGLAGEGIYWLSSTLFQRLGAHIIALLLLAAGALLLTGTSIATFLSGTGRALQRARQGGGEMAKTVAQRRGDWRAETELETALNPTELVNDYDVEADVTAALEDEPDTHEFEPEPDAPAAPKTRWRRG